MGASNLIPALNHPSPREPAMEAAEAQADGSSSENHGKYSPENAALENDDNQPPDVVTAPFAEDDTEPIAGLDVLDNHSVSTPSIDDDSQVWCHTRIEGKVSDLLRSRYF